ncbi:MAG TPA: glycosyltransferase family A protein [Thermoleophilaceae bacterium]|jgi:glycosyltransferase involved in cell wall biosynthesis
MSRAKPLISVVIPAYNGETFLEQAIESVLAQTWQRTELVVVDDGSTDRSAEIAGSYPVRLVRQENSGVAAARNRGVDEAEGELVSFLDQDDLLRPEKLERQLESLLAEPEAGMSSCQMKIFLEPGCPVPDWIDPGLLGREIHTLHLGTILAWRRTFEQVGRFDDSYRWGNDTDWFMRSREAGVPIVRVNEALMLYRVHEENESLRVGSPVTQDTLSAVLASVRRRRARLDDA